MKKYRYNNKESVTGKELLAYTGTAVGYICAIALGVNLDNFNSEVSSSLNYVAIGSTVLGSVSAYCAYKLRENRKSNSNSGNKRR